MNFNYAATAATASRLLARFGAPCLLARQTTGVYDPATGSAAVSTINLAATACVFDYPSGYVDGTLIQVGDRRAYMTPELEPKAGDKFTWASRDLTITSVKPIAPAGAAVLYEANVRG